MVKLSLGTGVDSNARRGPRLGLPPEPAPLRAPRLVRAPALAGAGRIGAAMAVDPGDWDGRPAPGLAWQWQRDGKDIPGATGEIHVPGPGDDLTELACRVTASNIAGTAAAVTAAITLRHDPPMALGILHDQSFVRDTGVRILNVSSNFTGAALTFSGIGEGISINPVTGEISIATDALRAGIPLTVTATNSGGAAAQSFRLTIAAEPAELATAPAMIAAPVLSGTGTVGSEVAVDPGSWSGLPVPGIALQWRRDGADIPGAVAAVYVPGPEDDGKDLTCRVTASNAAGSAAAETAALRVAYAAPVAGEALADLSFEAGSGAQVVEAGAAFMGEDLRFSVEGAGAEIDAATGRITIPTDAPLEDVRITVTAANSGGAATSSFRVSVTARGPAAFPAKLLVAEWSAVEMREAEPAGRRRVGIDAAVVVPEGFELRLYSGPAAGGVTGDFNRIMQPGEIFTTNGSLALGAICHNLLYWRRVEDDAWAQASQNAVSFEILGLEPVAPIPVLPVLIAAPLLSGTGKIGSAVAVEPGTWSAAPAPEFAWQWRHDGEDIADAVGAVYVPGPGDDLCDLTCRVTARNAVGSAAAETAALKVTHVAPVAAGGLFDEVFDQGTGVQSVAAAVDFVGEVLIFSVEGAGAEIDPETGVVGIPTEAAISGEVVTVAATNSGGSATSAFQVTVEATETGAPAPRRAADFRGAAIPAPGASFTHARDVGAYEPGRLVWVMVIANNAASCTIDGAAGRLIDSGTIGGAIGQVYVSDTTASEVTVAHSGATLKTPCVLWFTTVGYAAVPAAVARAGAGLSNQTPAALALAVPAGGGLLAGARNYNLLTAPQGLQEFTVGYDGGGITAGAMTFPQGAEGLQVTAARDAGNLDGKHLQGVVLQPEGEGGEGVTLPEEGEVVTAPPPVTPPLPPAPGEASPTTLVSSVTKEGVTFTFAQARPVGQYCNGDYFVLGPVTIKAISPASATVSTAGYQRPQSRDGAIVNNQRRVHGAMVNPIGDQWGFDNYIVSNGVGGPSYNATYNKDPAVAGALTLAEGSVVKAVSKTSDPGTGSDGRSVIERYVVLTVTPEIPAKGAFRPPVIGTDKRSYWKESGLNYGVLKKLTQTIGLPTLGQATNAVSAFFPFWNVGADFARPTRPRTYPNYGREIARIFGYCYARLHCNHTEAEKRPLLINCVQIGLDSYALIKIASFQGDGGNDNGFKLLAVLAGAALGNADIKSWMDGTRERYAEDRQFFRVTQAHVGKYVKPQGSSVLWRPRSLTYQQGHVGMPEWTVHGGNGQNAENSQPGAVYRSNWCSVALGCLSIMLTTGGVEMCKQPEFFEYYDRIMRWINGAATGQFQVGNTNWGLFTFNKDGHPDGMQSYERGFWNAHRGAAGMPVWKGQPEQPFPPALSVAGRTINGTFSDFQIDNGHAITRRDVRWSADGGATWTEIAGIGASFKLAGLPANKQIRVQNRCVNSAGAGPWSVNDPATQESSSLRGVATTGA